jgi:hypothetical protein
MKKGTIAIIVGIILISLPFVHLQVEKSLFLTEISQYIKENAKQNSIIEKATDSLYKEWVSSHDTTVGTIVSIKSQNICKEVMDTIWSHPYHSRNAWHSEAIRYAKRKSNLLRKKIGQPRPRRKMETALSDYDVSVSWHTGPCTPHYDVYHISLRNQRRDRHWRRCN